MFKTSKCSKKPKEVQFGDWNQHLPPTAGTPIDELLLLRQKCLYLLIYLCFVTLVLLML